MGNFYLYRACVRGRSGLTVQQLLVELKEVDDWYSLGAYLRVRVSKLREIKTSNSQGGVQLCKIEMFQYWLDSTPTASWEDVISALKQVDNLVLADRLTSKYTSGAESKPGSMRMSVFCSNINHLVYS